MGKFRRWQPISYGFLRESRQSWQTSLNRSITDYSGKYLEVFEISGLKLAKLSGSRLAFFRRGLTTASFKPWTELDCREELTRTSSEGNTSSVHDSYNREAGGLTFLRNKLKILIIKHNKIILLGLLRGIKHHIHLHLPHHHP